MQLHSTPDMVSVDKPALEASWQIPECFLNFKGLHVKAQ